ncbi:MAG: (d)CMP kinase, partial [Rickettsiales bacterium]|nr:(d)CMP kinase [Rickettsiales bacterium]
RDIGTVICPNAPYKFFITASVEVRAERRLKEEISKGISATFEDILQKIKERDKMDMEVHKKADDAIEIDTTHKTADEAFEYVLSFIK